MSLRSHLLGGVRQYGLPFAVELVLFWAALLTFEASRRAVHWIALFSVGFMLAAAGMGAAEWTFKLYRRVWTVAGLPDAVALVAGVLEAGVVVAALNLLLPNSLRPYELLAPVFAVPAAIGAVGLFRLAGNLQFLGSRAANRLLIVASGRQSYPAVKALIAQRIGWSPVGIVTVGKDPVHQTVMGVPVVGRAENLAHWLEILHVDGVAFVSGEEAPGDWRELLKTCIDAELPVFAVGGPREWMTNGNGPLRQLKADDLVGRSECSIEIDLSREYVQGKTVLVTGAAGSIGSEICRCLASLRPRRLVLLDNNESGLFDMVEELRATSTAQLRPALVSITDQEPLISLFAEERPDIVFHAAAYKHVPMLESHPLQAVMTNVIGTSNVLDCADAAGTSRFILISTDKAVARHSVMGCSKRLCELLVMSHEGPTMAWAVRFGNVVGSRGSVVPLFERQINQGGPVTITHPDATRYMMTKREAASLTIATLRLASASRVFMLDMGEPVNILRLANSLIRSRGLRPGTDIKLIFTGLRPGEIVTEELLAPDEAWRSTSHSAIREVVSTHPVVGSDDLRWTVERLRTLIAEGRADAVVTTLRRAIAAETAAVLAAEPAGARQPAIHS